MNAKQTDRDLVEALELWQRLSPADRAEARAYLKWMVEDGRPETDPTRDDPAWQEAKRRMASEMENAR
ncbi:MAG: hypothetical protein J0J10_17960 [Bosea sp.]|uniref:hypothetical protein n=1 Tax=Bosea sp. (in: a-proteobacteria) TaxID=1871050 RepID=UPI001AC7AA92|nr:hypothetical protein [Bosea sp. (in: a-proteobacteria)]MBN9470654.1 hypothetical protein [Bosea sp. (in: a-proteobacteria)]